MSESSDLRQRAKSAFQHAKQTVGVGDPPLATEVGGRVEAVREALRAFGDGDHDRFLSALGENVDWVAPRGENFPGAGSCDGRDAVKERFIGAVERSYTEFGFTPEHYLESVEENVVVVVGAFGGQGVKGPSQFDAPGVQIWEFDGDKVVGVQIFADSGSFPEAVDEDEPEEDEDDEQESEKDKDDDAKDSGDRAEGKSDAKDRSEGKSSTDTDPDKAKDKDEGGSPTDKSEDGDSGDGARAEKRSSEGSSDESAAGKDTQEQSKADSSAGESGQPERHQEDRHSGG